MLLTDIQKAFKPDSDTKRELDLAQKQENRIRFHTSAFNFDYYKFDPTSPEFSSSVNSINNLGKYKDFVNTDFFYWVKSILDESKYVRFLQLFELKTAETVEEIFTKLSRCTEAQDRTVDVYFSNEKSELDFEAYRTNILQDEKFFTETIFEDILQNNHNGILLIDINNEGKPYMFTITISQVVNVKVDSKNQIKYVLFQTDNKNEAYAYCDEYYRKFDVEKGFDNAILLEEFRHNLEYCPAHFLYNANLSTRVSKIVKESVLSKYLDGLDFLLFLNTSQKYLNTYAYPIMEIPSKDCNYTDFKGNQCDGGYITSVSETVDGQTIITECPKCAKNHFIGAGSVIVKDITINPENSKPEYLQDVVKFVAPPVDSIELSERTAKMKEKSIIFKTTGFFDNNSDTNEQAKNEIQIQSSFETQVSKLQKFQKPLEASQRFVIETAAKLLYPNEFLFTIVDWGRNYYLRSEDELLRQLDLLRAANAPNQIIDLVEQEFINQKLKNKPLLQTRYELLNRLNQYSNFSYEQLNDLYTKGILNNVSFSLATNFNYYLDMFEMEFGDISNYKPNLSLKARVSEIKTKLESYVTISEETTRPTGDVSNPQGQTFE